MTLYDFYIELLFLCIQSERRENSKNCDTVKSDHNCNMTDYNLQWKTLRSHNGADADPSLLGCDVNILHFNLSGN